MRAHHGTSITLLDVPQDRARDTLSNTAKSLVLRARERLPPAIMTLPVDLLTHRNPEDISRRAFGANTNTGRDGDRLQWPLPNWNVGESGRGIPADERITYEKAGARTRPRGCGHHYGGPPRGSSR